MAILLSPPSRTRRAEIDSRAKNFASARDLKRPDDDEHDDRKQEQRRDLVEDAVPAMRARVTVVLEVAEEQAAPDVIDDEEDDERQLEVQPLHVLVRLPGVGEKEPQAEDGREHAAGRGDAPEQLALHDFEALD